MIFFIFVVPNSKALEFAERWEQRNTFTLKKYCKEDSINIRAIFLFHNDEEHVEKETLQPLAKHRVVSSKQE